MAATALYPLADKELLRTRFVGRSIKDVDTPAAILDLSKIRRNCRRMLEACELLDVGWRAHIKTHKTTELARLQVGTGNGPIKIIVSTVIEAEHIVPLLLEYKSNGRSINVLYSFPIAPSVAPRLSLVAQALGDHGLSVMVDHPTQLEPVITIQKASGVVLDIFLKIDMGSQRAGVPIGSEAASNLIAATLALTSSGTCHFLGLYAHAGHSYNGATKTAALDILNEEFDTLLHASKSIKPSLSHPLVLSVGATPSAMSIMNLLVDGAESDARTSISRLQSTIQSIRDTGCSLEVHAGVYAILDLQQLSTHALPSLGPQAVALDDIALTVVVEVTSLYPSRGTNNTTEALIGAGTLALGREPCKSYPGWAIPTPWNRSGIEIPTSPEAHSGWIVGRISQEHGIINYYHPEEASSPVISARVQDNLHIGQKIRLWPNHACVVGAGFGWYLIVDGSDEIIDVWVRWRGW